MNKFFLSIGSIVYISLALISPPPILAQQQIVKTITVTGKGTQRIPATVANIQLGVEIEGKNATQIQEEVAKRTTSLVELLKSSNVENLQTTGIRLQPNYNYNNNQRELTGYTATNLVSFQLPIDRVGSLLDNSVKVGATRIDNVSLTAEENAIAEAQKQALASASLDAQQQAQAVLSALNLTAQEIITINVNGANVPLPIAKEVMLDRAVSPMAMATTPVIGGEQEVTAFVTLQIRY
jgi:uncharacterized protein YggE